MKTNTYYEAHITLLGSPERIKPAVDLIKWKFSVIDGDPVLGKGVKCYATKHFNAKMDKEEVLMDLRMAADALEYALPEDEVIRRKIELVIFDDRSSAIRFRCDGKCPECHSEDICSK